jgi:hypothetical protein
MLDGLTGGSDWGTQTYEMAFRSAQLLLVGLLLSRAGEV